IEPQFYAEFLQRMTIDDPEFSRQYDASLWPALKLKLAAQFKTKTRDQWCAVLAGSDACFAPVLDMEEAPQHVHNRARGTFIEIDGVMQPAPAPRFSRTDPRTPRRAAGIGENAADILRGYGFDETRIAELGRDGVI
ncbi:MAG: CoA transferase, partial [Candidatus Obscuribacterales bacterium]|nr:CoA transferase [Steroidobacteraceae bacterium]